MSEQTSSPDTRSDALSIRQVIGLDTPDGTDWKLVHGQQYALLKERVVARAVLHLVGFLMVAATLYGAIPVALLAAWGIGLLVAVGYSARADIRLADAGNRMISYAEMKSHALMTAGKGALWSVGMILAALFADEAILQLDAPISRIGGSELPLAHHAEQASLPTVDQLTKAIAEVTHY